jgi:hypothetical protein
LAAPVSGLPSGQSVELTDVLLDEAPGALWVRFRFLAPAIARQGGTVWATQAFEDMDHLCNTVALPYLAEYALDPVRIVISLSDRAVAFGEPAPEATQYFGQYSQGPEGCMWEEY